MAVATAAAQAAKVLRLPPMPSPGDLLRMYRLKALKQMSQNFLLDPRICKKFVRCAGPLKNSHVIEVGPGPGCLTRPILAKGATCIAIEKDKRFMPCLDILAEAAEGRLKVVYDDVLEYQIEKDIPQELALPWDSEYSPKIHLIGNLPFSVSTALLIRWLKMVSERSGPWQYGRVGMTLSFQKEVSTRLNVGDIHPEKCRLSIISQGYCEVKECFTIVGGSFVPPPLVDVGVVKLVPRVEPVFKQKFHLVEKVLRVAFNAKRNYTRATLRNLFPRQLWGDAFLDMMERARIDPTIRTYLLTVDDFSRICDSYAFYCNEIEGLYNYDFRAPKHTTETGPKKIF